jgi:hypothetical protein
MVVAVEGAALYAPLVHAHLDDHDAHHYGERVVHAHFAGHTHGATRSPGGPALREDKTEQVFFLQLFVAVASVFFEAPASVARFFELSPPREISAHLPLLVVHGHDPPCLAFLPPRAPPIFLSQSI